MSVHHAIHCWRQETALRIIRYKHVPLNVHLMSRRARSNRWVMPYRLFFVACLHSPDFPIQFNLLYLCTRMIRLLLDIPIYVCICVDDKYVLVSSNIYL